MATGTTARTPFDAGINSVAVQVDAPNPFCEGSIEFRNFELGREFALRRLRTQPPYPVRPTSA